MHRLCIDARLYGIKDTGIGRYTENLLLNIPRDSQVEIYVLVRQVESNLPAYMKQVKMKFHPYHVLSQVEVLGQLMRIRPHLFHATHFTIPILWPGKMVITIHDLIKHMVKGSDTTTKSPWLYWPKYIGYLINMYVAIHRATYVITPSNYWRNKIISLYKCNAPKVLTLYEGVDEKFFKPRPHSQKIKNQIVYTGNVYPHKNLQVAIDAATQLGMPLKIVCARSVFTSRLPSSPYVEYIGKVSDEELIKLYQDSFAFVFPSLYEGFGLTGLEAMAASLPVIAANSSCLPEIYKDGAIYFDPTQVSELIALLNKLKTGEIDREKLIKQGITIAKSYSWNKMGIQTWAIYQKILQ